VILKVEVDTG